MQPDGFHRALRQGKDHTMMMMKGWNIRNKTEIIRTDIEGDYTSDPKNYCRMQADGFHNPPFGKGGGGGGDSDSERSIKMNDRFSLYFYFFTFHDG